MSNSSLYGTPPNQDVSSTNSTSLYGGADTPIPTSDGNIVVRGDLIVLSGNILTTATTGNIFPANATTVNLGLAATTVNIGAGSGTTTINNDLTVGGDITADGADFGNIQIAVTDNNTIDTTSGGLKLSSTTGEVGLVGADTLYTDQSNFLLLNFPTTVTAFDSATSLTMGDVTGITNIRNALTVGGDVTAPGADLGLITIGVADDQTITTTSGELRLSSATTTVKLEGVTSLYTDTTGTFNLLNIPTTINAFQNATALTIGETTGTTTVRNDLVVQGGVTANGADFGDIQIAVADNQTITTTTGELRLSSTNGTIKLAGVDTMYTDEATFNLLNNPTTVYAFRNATTLELGEDTGTTTINNNLDIEGNRVGLAPATSIVYDENNNRLNRPAVRSTTGNSSGFRVEAPNATGNAVSTITAFSSNDNANGKFININARGSTFSSDLRIQTGKYTAGVLGDSGSVVSFIDNATLYATVNPAGPTDPLDLTTKTYVDSLPANITYTVDASSTTGGANFNLVGSDSTTDTVKFSGGTNVTVTATSANEITISAPDTNTTYTQNSSATTGGANLNLVGSDSTTDTIKFAGGTNVTVVSTDANTITISAPDTNTTYTQNISATTGGANLNLVGSDATTDTVKFANGVGVDVSYTDANTATIAIGQAVGTTDNVQFNGVTTNSITTGTVNANGGVSFVNTAPLGGTYATVNQFGPVNSTDLTTVDYVNSILPVVVTYTQDASVTTGGANVNLVGSNSTTDTIKYAGAGSVSVVATDANTVTITGTDTNTTYTQDVSSTTGGANLNLVGSDSTTDSVKFAGGTNVTVVATDANTMTINATDTNTTYDFAATATTGGANLNLTGSDATTDTVKISDGTGVTVTQISGTEVSVAIGQSVGTGDTPSFAGVSAGNLTVGVATDNTIASTNTDGDIVLDPNGTGEIVLSSIVRAQGEIQANTNLNYVFPPQTLNTVTDNNGYSAASSFPSGTNGYGANAGFQHYYGDTLAGTNTAPAFSFRGATGNSVTGDVVPFTGLTSVAPSAIASGNVMGTLNFSGYATTGFSNDVASQYQGGGLNSLQSLQIQGYAAEAFNDSILTLTSTNVTGVTSFRAPMSAVSVVGTKGQIQFTATTPSVGIAIRVTGTLTGTATGIVSGQTYYVIVTNGTTTATLSATPGGSPIDTTAGTLTGLTLTRCGVTFTMTGLTNVPFGRGALVAVSGVTNVVDGTYPVVGTPTTTSMLMGIPQTVAPTLSGTQSFSCRTSYNGGGIRIRAFPTGIPANFQNRLEMLDMTPAATTVRSSTITLNTGAYGNTGVGITGNNIIYNRVYGQWQNITTVVPAAANTAYAFALPTIDFTNIATVNTTSRIVPGAAGMYKLQFSAQVQNDDSASEHIAYFWWRKNGTDVVGSMGRVGVPKAAGAGDALTIAGWDNMISSANATDYWELMYAVDDATHVTFPTFAATAFGPATSALFVTLVPIGA